MGHVQHRIGQGRGDPAVDQVVVLGEAGLVGQPGAAYALFYFHDLQAEVVDVGHAIYEILQFLDGYLGH